MTTMIQTILCISCFFMGWYGRQFYVGARDNKYVVMVARWIKKAILWVFDKIKRGREREKTMTKKESTDA